MAIRGAESACQAVSTRSFTPSQFLDYVRSDGEVTACERNQLYALAAEFRQRLSGKSADVPRFDSETDAARETAALDEIETLCAESGCDMPEQGAVAGNEGSIRVFLVMASVGDVAYGVVVGIVALGLGIGLAWRKYKLARKADAAPKPATPPPQSARPKPEPINNSASPPRTGPPSSMLE